MSVESVNDAREEINKSGFFPTSNKQLYEEAVH